MLSSATMPKKIHATVHILIQAVVDRAKRDRVAFIDVGDEIAVIKAELPAGTPFDEEQAKIELARLAAANRIPVRME
jgi:hypothetical protein